MGHLARNCYSIGDDGEDDARGGFAEELVGTRRMRRRRSVGGERGGLVREEMKARRRRLALDDGRKEGWSGRR